MSTQTQVSSPQISYLVNHWVKKVTDSFKLRTTIPTVIIHLCLLFFGLHLDGYDFWTLYELNEEIKKAIQINGDDDLTIVKDLNEEMEEAIQIDGNDLTIVNFSRKVIYTRYCRIFGTNIIKTRRKSRFVWTLKILNVKASYGQNFTIGICQSDGVEDKLFGIGLNGRCRIKPWDEHLVNPLLNRWSDPRVRRYFGSVHEDMRTKIFKKGDCLKIKMYVAWENNKLFDIEFYKDKYLLIEYKGLHLGGRNSHCRLCLEMGSNQSWQIVNFKAEYDL